MKFLKKYKLFESSSIDNMIEDIRDILLELDDINIKSSLSKGRLFGASYASAISIKFYEITDFFKLSNIREILSRIDEYCSTLGYRVFIFYNSYRMVTPDEFISLDIEGSELSVLITQYK